MNIFLCAVDPRLARAWRQALPQEFGPAAVQVIEGDILSLPMDAVVSPANSFGFMDGGLDALYTRFFGPQLQERLQRMIREQADGELLVEQALPVETGHARIPWCISAPTMRVPRRLESAEAAYLATRAAVRCALAAGVESVAIPGMGTGTGGLPPESAARAMLRGIQDVFFPRPFPASLVDVATF
ncbi:MAG TPA: macro domain-containing protein [Candidatus Desulfovibrio intestinigallinarum]|nr:macro domain-containing protein [Candidatus Desulfovibrio intestinigallinarum]